MENAKEELEKTIEGITFNKANCRASIGILGGKEQFIAVAKKKYWTEGVNEATQLKRIEAAYAWIMDEPKYAPKAVEVAKSSKN